MKKILTLVCCTILLAATSCTKKYVSPATTNRTIFFTVQANEWGTVQTDDEFGSFYAVDLGNRKDDNGTNLPELDGAFQEFGAVLVYISFDGGDTYEAVPETLGGLAFSFRHTVNNIRIYSQTPDGTGALKPKVEVKFKVVLIDSNGVD